MPLEQTITIVNNSGKIINNGKQLFSIFTDAKNSYIDKKNEIKQLKRSQTLQEAPRDRESSFDQENYKHEASRPPLTARRSYDAQSVASSRHSHRSRSSSRYHEGSTPRSSSRPPLTLANLKTHSEVSSVAPSRRTPPNAYRAPSQADDARTTAMTQRPPAQLARRHSEYQMSDPQPQGVVMKKPKEVDMNLAYGNVPPDLEHLPEYDPQYQDPNKERQAKFLVGKVEGLLGEAECLQSSAGTIIKRLQEDPNAAASVALTLSELSKVAAKMSPAFLGLLKGSSPAVFGLLASPQFLIGTSVLAGVTVVMFGGWKIVQKMRDNQVARETIAYHETPDGRPAVLRTQTEPPIIDKGYDEALVLDDDISTIESWRRGIPFGDDASADFELITPEADRARREIREIEDDTRSHRSTRTTKTSSDPKKSSRDKERSSRRAESVAGSEVPERKSSRRAESTVGSEAPERKSRRAPESVAGSERSTSSRKKHSSSSSTVSKSESKSKKKGTEEPSRGRSSSRGGELVVRPRGAESNNMLKAMFRSKEKQLVLA